MTPSLTDDLKVVNCKLSMFLCQVSYIGLVLIAEFNVCIFFLNKVYVIMAKLIANVIYVPH